MGGGLSGDLKRRNVLRPAYDGMEIVRGGGGKVLPGTDLEMLKMHKKQTNFLLVYTDCRK